MCLDTKTRRTIKEGTGYKLFQRTSHGLIGWNYNYMSWTKILPLNKWVNEKTYRPPQFMKDKLLLCEDKKTHYKIGFHTFIDLQGVTNYKQEMCGTKDNWVIYEVQFKDVVAQGIQRGHKCIVHTKMKIIKEVQ